MAEEASKTAVLHAFFLHLLSSAFKSTPMATPTTAVAPKAATLVPFCSRSVLLLIIVLQWILVTVLLTRFTHRQSTSIANMHPHAKAGDLRRLKPPTGGGVAAMQTDVFEVGF